MEPDKIQLHNLSSPHKAFNDIKQEESDFPKKEQELLGEEQLYNCSLKKPYDEQHLPLEEGQLQDYLSLARETPAGDIRTEECGRTQECVLQWEKLLQKRNHQIDSANTNLLLTAENAESLQKQNGDPIYGTDPRRKPVRLENMAERRRQRAALKRQQESPEQRAIRRERDRLHVRFARMEESAEQRQIRLETNRIAVKERRQRETSDDRAARLMQNRVSKNIARLSESPEQRQLRLLKGRQRVNARRQRETMEERETRLRKTRERMAAIRNGETSNRERWRQERDQFNHEASGQPMRQQNNIRHALERELLTVDQSQYNQELRTFSHAIVREADEYNGRHQSQHIASATPTSIHHKDSANTDPPWKLHAHSAASYCETQITLPSNYHDDSGHQCIKTEFQSDDSGDFVSADMIGSSTAKCLSNIYSEIDIKSEFVDVNDIKLWP